MFRHGPQTAYHRHQLRDRQYSEGNFIGSEQTVPVGTQHQRHSNIKQCRKHTVGGNELRRIVDASCNRIANNGVGTAQTGKAGVYVDNTAGVGNRIRRNSIYNNLGIGIDLAVPGATANDTMDPDAGPNNTQNKPVIASATESEFIAAQSNSTTGSTLSSSFRNVRDSEGRPVDRFG